MAVASKLYVYINARTSTKYNNTSSENIMFYVLQRSLICIE